MIKINPIEDLLFPGVVPILDYVFSEKVPATEPGKYADYAGLGTCLAGYGLAAFGFGGNYSKNIGIASLDWAVNAVRNLVKGAGVTRQVSQSQRLVMRPASQRLVMSPASRVAGITSQITRSYQPEMAKAIAF